MDDDAEPPAPSPLSSPGGSPKQAEVIGEIDNREVEDMELSEDEVESGGIIGKEAFICHVVLLFKTKLQSILRVFYHCFSFS